jgi:type II restriction enzyme
MPSKHNQLSIAIAEEFIPRFAQGAKLIYRSDPSQKNLVLDKAAFAKLGISVSQQGNFPDMILYDSKKKWLFLIEMAHAPVSPQRHIELEKLFKKCKVGKIYVTALADFSTYAKYADEIAWETEVWIAEMPSHMIHYNGDKFLGPR